MSQEADNKTETVNATAYAPVGKSTLPSSIKVCVRVVLTSALSLLVLLTLYVTAGRLLMPLLDTQKANIEASLSSMLGAEASIDSLQGSWFRFNPGFMVSGLSLQLNSEDPDSVLEMGRVEFSLDLWESLARQQLTLKSVSFSQLQLALMQNASGAWSLRGGAEGGGFKDKLLDILLSADVIKLDESLIRLYLSDGREIPLNAFIARVSNKGEEHSLNLQFRLGEQQSPTIGVLNLQGDPRQDFELSAWLGSAAIDLRSQLEVLFPPEWSLNTFTSAFDIWLKANNTGLTSLQARVNDLQIEGRYAEQALPIAFHHAAFELSLQPSNKTNAQLEIMPGWEVAIQDLAFDLNNTPWDLPFVALSLPQDPAQAWHLQAETVEAGLLADIANKMPLPQIALEALSQLSPSGNLINFSLQAVRQGDYPELFLLRSNFDQLAVGAWNGAPAGSGLSGYTQLSAFKGFADVDSTDASIYLPNLFNQAWEYESLNTRVKWFAKDGEVRVSSSPIYVRNESLQGRVQFSLHNNSRESGELETELALLVAMDYMDVAHHAAYLPTMPSIASTMDWLDEALLTGNIVNSGFVLRTPIVKNSLPSSATQASWFRVEDGRLKFLPAWPEASVEKVGIVVQDLNTDVLGINATIQELPLASLTAKIRPDADGQSLLSLQTAGLVETSSGIEFLRTSPLRSYVGPALDSWQASGQLDLDVQVAVPLGRPSDQLGVTVEAVSQDSDIYISDYELNIQALDGVLNFTADRGLQASTLSAQMFDAPVSLQIASTVDSSGKHSIKVSSAGKASIDALSEWEGQATFIRSLLRFTEGELSYTAELNLPAVLSASVRPVLSLRSNLVGIESSLPAPFQKPTTKMSPLNLDIRYLENDRQINIRYEDSLSGQLLLDEEGINRGQLYFGELNESFNIRQTNAEAEGLLISGKLATFSWEEWQAIAKSIEAEQEESSSLSDYLRLIDVNVDLLQVAEQEFENINVQVQHKDAAWHIFGENSMLSGIMILPDQVSAPWDVALEYLRFPARVVPDDEQLEEEDLLQDFDPSTLPAFAFSVDELSIGEHNLGAFSFDLSPYATGAAISNFVMQEAASSIKGIGENRGANIDWSYQNNEHLSSYTGEFNAGDLSAVMPKWGHDANIVSRNAQFSSTLSWPSSPLAFSLSNATGDLSMRIRNGRFVDINSGSSRLLGAFNFDALIRRLELDFSDLYEKGFSYDTISGELAFVDGLINTKTPLIIDGPSSRLSINGAINLKNETIAADMQVRIPLGENISLLAGLLGAWPIAVSTYLASKIFSDQVEDFTTIIYRLEGPWDNPQAGFEAPDSK